MTFGGAHPRQGQERPVHLMKATEASIVRDKRAREALLEAGERGRNAMEATVLINPQG